MRYSNEEFLSFYELLFKNGVEEAEKRASFIMDVLNKDEFNNLDIKEIESRFPIELIDNSVMICLGKNKFLFNHEDINKLTSKHYDMLSDLSKKEVLHNPVIVKLDGDGELIIE